MDEKKTDVCGNIELLLQLQEGEIFRIREYGENLYRFMNKILQINKSSYPEIWDMADGETFFAVMTAKYTVLRFPTVETSLEKVIHKYCHCLVRKHQILQLEEYVRKHYQNDLCLESFKKFCLIYVHEKNNPFNEVERNELMYIAETFFGKSQIDDIIFPLVYVLDKEIVSREIDKWCKKA